MFKGPGAEAKPKENRSSKDVFIRILDEDFIEHAPVGYYTNNTNS